MDERTLTALKESIAKWEKNARAKSVDDMTLGWRNCPLCLDFIEEFNCIGCPVFERTRQEFCDGTPYEYFDAAGPYDVSKAREVAKQEVEFLKSLLPEGESV